MNTPSSPDLGRATGLTEAVKAIARIDREIDAARSADGPDRQAVVQGLFRQRGAMQLVRDEARARANAAKPVRIPARRCRHCGAKNP